MNQTIAVEVDSKALWEATFGSGWDCDPVMKSFCVSAEYLGEADWETIGEVKFTYYKQDDFYDGKPSEIILGIADIERGFQIALTRSLRDSCCGDAISTDFWSWDACVGTTVLQLAIFGEEIYG